MDKELLEILACPKCKGALEHVDTSESEAFLCHVCRLRFLVEDGIPNFLIDEAEALGNLG